MRRKAHNWAVEQMCTQHDMRSRCSAACMEPLELRPVKHRGPLTWFSLRGLCKRWNQVKNGLCVDAETCEVWWPDLSKEAAANGIDDAVTAYWNWADLEHSQRQTPAQAAVMAATATHTTNNATAAATIHRTSPARRAGTSTKRHDKPAATTEPTITIHGLFVKNHNG